MTSRGSLSDFWRQDISDDRVGELTSVLRGSDSLVGVMGSGVRVVWSTNGESQTWWVRTKAGKRAEMRVFLDYSPLAELIPPFYGEAVDEVIGYAAHEGGHCLWSSEDTKDIVGRLLAGRKKRRKWGTIPEAIDDILRVANILEDAFIDCHVGEEWPVLGEYIRISRRKVAERRPIDLDVIAQDPSPTYNQMVNLWIACSLYDHDLPKRMSAKVRRAMTFLMNKSVEAVQTSNCELRLKLSIDCYEYLITNFPKLDDPLPKQQPQSQAEKGEEGEKGEGGGKGKAEETGGEAEGQGAGEAEEAEEEEPEAEEEGEGKGKEEEAEKEEAETKETGEAEAETEQPEDIDKEGEGEGEAETEPEAEPAEPEQELGHFGGEEGEQPPEGEPEESSQQGGDEQGSPGNLDDFDIRDVEEMPERLLEEVLDAVIHEMEDISRSVAEVINKPLADVNAQTKRGDYDAQSAERVRQQVEGEIQEMRRVFDRQASVKSRTLKGLTVGKLNRRSLARVGAGSFKVFQRREILDTPDLAVGLLLDVSGSMDSHMDYVWATGCVFAEGLIRKKGVNFLALTYTGGMFECQTTRICDRDMGRLCMGNVEQGGGTPSGSAIASLKTLMDRMTERQKVIIHFTDGYPDDRISVTTAVEACRRAGYWVWAISLQGYESMLAQQYGDGNWETIDSIKELPGKVANLVKKLVVSR